ncbi:Uma2 family endonuclease [Sphaerospermopsis torques-reginae]|uniref:Uma2 family endonuclease n=1 Tax=Sphaerospermopsis torques-reginae ITEP-024 TaxID=984208 RepID=A0ABX8X406_9CYAN|nr:Uma2 family endonuclease [Sphaerospermopsis torques-reginae]QYX33411.1 Uma2 family endonuclease [Sphaerospermopsis torques-reginae ITEP-024]
MIANHDVYITPEQYLALEEKSPVKHEYINGYIYAMAGASDPHVTVTLNSAFLIRNHIRGSGCRVFATDMKTRIETINRFYYPDVMVTCDERDKALSNYKKFPCLIIEILSDSTEAFDRGDKFKDYQNIETLQEYVLIDVKKPQVDCFRRNDQDLWVLQSYTQSSFELQSLNFQGNMDDLYEYVSFL